VIRVLVAEDMQILRDTLSALLRLEDDIDAVAEAADGDAILSAAASRQPDVALVDAVQKVNAGQRVFDEQLTLSALEVPSSPLAPREAEVLRRFATGAGPAEIAAELCLSYGTVRNYLASAVTKLDARNRVDAVRIAAEAGWL
jgi:DNA-binding NarL/FixJ family response regulator